ncbi:hypothetical protein QGM71_02580 [Virgibacillus sp. C22-A2]|uniref:Uncharacterized protein n=1 Tax=Virgibacillus tibetensis TaxID=3042313 RepID=A0ABU6KAL4_9BACI|nr:hypothetical protein [Virgibacillus sp. C22-A2]
MSERMEEIAFDIRNSIPEIIEVLQQKEGLAERVEELEKENERLKKGWRKEEKNHNTDKGFIYELYEKGKKKDIENKRYKQALEFYADKKNYDIYYDHSGVIGDDEGKKARQALKGDPNVK